MIRATYLPTPQGTGTTWIDGHMLAAVPASILLAMLIVRVINAHLARKHGGQ